MKWLYLAPLVLLLGCGDAVEANLILPEAWVPVSLEDDPFADRYDGQPCDPRGLSVENGIAEIDTTLCRFGTLTQPALISVQPDELVKSVMFHDTLFNEETAEGVSIVALGPSAWWTEEVVIPAEAKVHPYEALAGVALEAGEPVYWHVDNHGGNSWNLSHIRVVSTRWEARRAAD